MKYIYNYIEHSLNESFNSKEAKKQFLDKGLISKKDFAIIKKAFLPKYVYWGCREKANSENTSVILDSIYDVTIWFEKSKQYLKSKDLYTYTYEEIRLKMNDPSIGPKKKKVRGEGKYKILYEDHNSNILVRADDHTASVYWAHKYREGEIADGQWCTAAYNTDNLFKIHSELNPIHIMILPNENNKEYQRVCSVATHNRSYFFTSIKTGKIIEENANITREFYNAYDKKLVYKDASKLLKKYSTLFNRDEYKPISYKTKVNINDISFSTLMRTYLSNESNFFSPIDFPTLSSFQNGPDIKNILAYCNKNFKPMIDGSFNDTSHLQPFSSQYDEYKKMKNLYENYIKDGYVYMYGFEFTPIQIMSKIKINKSPKYNISVIDAYSSDKTEDDFFGKPNETSLEKFLELHYPKKDREVNKANDINPMNHINKNLLKYFDKIYTSSKYFSINLIFEKNNLSITLDLGMTDVAETIIKSINIIAETIIKNKIFDMMEYLINKGAIINKSNPHIDDNTLEIYKSESEYKNSQVINYKNDELPELIFTINNNNEIIKLTYEDPINHSRISSKDEFKIKDYKKYLF